MNHITKLSALALMLASAASLQAAITTSVTANSTTGVAGITSWPSPYTVSSTSPNPGVNFTVTENNYGAASLFSIGQSWTATTSGFLSDIQITISGTAPVNFNVALYEANSPVWANIGAGTYNPGVNTTANLFSDTAGETWGGFTVGGATAAVLDFSLSGADQVAITSGKQYIFEISSTSNPSGMIWFRQGAVGDYAGGQAFRQRSPLNGNPARDMAIAVNVVETPEPTTAALLGLGALAVVSSRRRKA